MERAAFLDRDGTLNERPPPHAYVESAAAFQWIDGAAEAVARLSRAGYRPILVSNQRGVARGLISEQTLREIEEEIHSEVTRHGGEVGPFYYCVHDLDEGCDCRKPAPGLITRAAAERDIELAGSVMIGDSESDVEAGRAAGCRTARIAPDGTRTDADMLVPDLAAAATAIGA